MRVLFADDKETWHKLFDTVLSLRGIDVIHAHTPREALNKAASEKPDVAILDFTLSAGSSFDVIRNITDLGIPVIAIGHRAEGFDPEKALELGAYAVLEKPFTVEDLLDLLKQLRLKKPVLEEKTSLILPTGEEITEESFKDKEREEVALNLDLAEPAESASQEEVPAPEETEVGEKVLSEPIELVPLEEPSKEEEEKASVSIEEEEIPVLDLDSLSQEEKGESSELKFQEERKEPASVESSSLALPPEKVEEIIKEIAWEVVPEIAEKVIREEIEKLIKSRLA